jgi:hypothetical protein
MATVQTKTRGQQLVKTEQTGTVQRFFRRDTGAFIGAFDTAKLPDGALHRAAMHGLTQNLLDSSNKLEGQARCDHIARQCEIVQAGGWASAPSEVNIDAAKAKMIAALVAAGRSPEEAAKMVAGLGI